MSLLNVNLADAKKFTTIANDTQCTLRIAQAEIKAVKADPSRSQLYLQFVDPSDPTVQEIRFYLAVPTANMQAQDERAYIRLVNRWESLAKATGVDVSQAEERDFVGCDVEVVVGEEEDPQYGMQNFIRRFVPKR